MGSEPVLRTERVLLTPVPGYALAEALDDAYDEATAWCNETKPTTDDRLGRRGWDLVTLHEEAGQVCVRVTFDRRLVRTEP